MRSFMLRGRNWRTKYVWWLFGLALIVVPSISAIAASPSISEINSPGFGDSNNSFARSMAWFRGSLYVGTTRDQMCVYGATRQRYTGKGYSTNPEKGVYCPPNVFDLDLRAEIWRYTPTSDTSGQWTMVYQSPVITNPADPSKTIALDIDYRGMIVYTPPGGEPALYVAGTSAGSFISQIQDNVAPRILRTTDGTNFTSITGAPYNIYTPDQPVNGIHPIGYRSMEVFDNRLFVTASEGLLGTGEVMEVGQPWADQPTFTQVTPNTFYVFEIAAFNNQLYIGNGDETNGFSVFRTSATGTAPYTYYPVVTNGAGRGGVNNSVVSMYVFNNRLYVGSGGGFRTNIPIAELIRIAPDDSWELVVGKARNTTEGYQFPISGWPTGFGNFFNMLFWRIEGFNNGVYLGTGDWSWLVTKPTFIKLLSWEFGFDVYGSCDGQHWFTSTIDAFGDGQYNFGARTMLNTPIGGMIGTANFVEGARVFSATPGSALPSCSPFSISDYWSAPFNLAPSQNDGTLSPAFAAPSASSAAFDPASGSSQPAILLADVQPGGTVLSWDPASGAKMYRVYRAEFISNSKIGIPSPHVIQASPSDLIPEVVEVPDSGPIDPNANILGQFKPIGTSMLPFYVDKSAQPGVTYAYEVRAESGTAGVSGFSNMVVTPSEAANPTFSSTNSFISSLVAKGQLSQDSAATISATLNTAQQQSAQNQTLKALKTLGKVIQAVEPGSGLIADDVYAEELATQVSSLQRSVALAKIAMGTASRSPGGSITIPMDTPIPASSSSTGSGVLPFSNGSSTFLNRR